MRNTAQYKDKKITVVGLARSGLSCAVLLDSLGARVSVTDAQDTPALRANAAQLPAHIDVQLGGHTLDFIRGRDLLVVSPGVPFFSQALEWARQEAIPALGEIEIAWSLCPATVIAVTGSGGKSTVTTLIGDMLRAWGRRAFVCGNIGTPFSGEVPHMQPEDFVSLEISSFQLETIKSFKPKIAVMLNFNRNHLDRHKDMQEYLDAKKRIFMNQGQDDHLVLNAQDEALSALAAEAKSQVRFFSAGDGFNLNQSAVLQVGAILGISRDVCRKVFAGFKGLEHRLEFVAQVRGVRYVNDSKATLVESTAWGIRTIETPIILIAGGRDKGVEYRGILEDARQKVKKVILIGEAKQKIRSALEGALSIDEAATLAEAVAKAQAAAAPGDTVVLSPMCSSYDMFTDYVERGRVFKQLVRALRE